MHNQNIILIFVKTKTNTMGKTLKITREQIMTFERSARRRADIECGVDIFKHKVHKSDKDYNRRENKKIVWKNLVD